MVEKIDADRFREMSTKDLQSKINDLKKQRVKVYSSEMGSGKPEQQVESLGTIKRNIARAKTVLNERLDNEVEA